MCQEEIILASSSPRRRELFALFKLPYRCVSADLNENQLPDENPTDYVTRLALQKGEAIKAENLVLSADTIVVCEGEVLGKPANDHEAQEMLRRMRGNRIASLQPLPYARKALGSSGKTFAIRKFLCALIAMQKSKAISKAAITAIKPAAMPSNTKLFIRLQLCKAVIRM